MKTRKMGSIQERIGEGGTFQKYRNISTGQDRGIGFFFLNEITAIVSCSVPGKFGYKIRHAAYSLLCFHMGKNVIIGRECSFRRPQHISIDDNTVIDDRVSLDVKNDGDGIFLEKNITIGYSTIFSCPGGKITIGHGTKIGKFCRLGSLDGLTIGKNVTIGDFSYIVGAGHEFSSTDIPIIQQDTTCKGSSMIGDNVVIGERVTILDGVEIGEGVRIMDDSLVNRDVPARGVVSGVPAKLHA